MKTLNAARALSFKRAIRITILRWRSHGTFKRQRYFYSHWAKSTFSAKKKRKKRFVVFEFFFALNVGDNELWDRSSHLRSSLGTKIISSALSTKMAAWKTRELFWVIAGDWALNMDRKDSDVHDNFFASLNQLILSLEPAIKEAGSVAAAEDILTHLEATDENFHRFVLTHWHVSKLTAFHLNIFVLLGEFRLK